MSQSLTEVFNVSTTPLSGENQLCGQQIPIRGDAVSTVSVSLFLCACVCVSVSVMKQLTGLTFTCPQVKRVAVKTMSAVGCGDES